MFQISTPLTSNQIGSYHTSCVLIPRKLQQNFEIEQTQFEHKTNSAFQISSQKTFQNCNVDALPLARSSSLLATSIEGKTELESDIAVSSSMFKESVVNKDIPAWFGKGCRKLIKKKGKLKRRRQTN